MTSSVNHPPDQGESAAVKLVYITASTRGEAEEIARAALEARLAACANIIDGMRALYWWEGEIQSDDEVVLIMKTTAQLTEALSDLVKSKHSYECPCVVVLDIEGGNDAFIDWIGQETR